MSYDTSPTKHLATALVRRPPIFKYPTKCLTYYDCRSTGSYAVLVPKKICPTKGSNPLLPRLNLPLSARSHRALVGIRRALPSNNLHHPHDVTNQLIAGFIGPLSPSLRLALPTLPPQIFRAPNIPLGWVNDLELFARFTKLPLTLHLSTMSKGTSTTLNLQPTVFNFSLSLSGKEI